MLFQERGLKMSNAHEISQTSRYTILDSHVNFLT